MEQEEWFTDKLLLECTKNILLCTIACLVIVAHCYPDIINEFLLLAILYWAEKTIIAIPFKSMKQYSLIVKLIAIVGTLAVLALVVYCFWPNIFDRYWEEFILSLWFTIAIELPQYAMADKSNS